VDPAIDLFEAVLMEDLSTENLDGLNSAEALPRRASALAGYWPRARSGGQCCMGLPSGSGWPPVPVAAALKKR
jgi:hypothetical protein